MLVKHKRIAACISIFIFNRLRAMARYWSEIATFSYPLAFNAPVGGDPLDDLCDFLRVSCRMARLQYGAKISPKS